jgi:ABC-type branched-subunit amino acid transport system substrate-binding protein
VQNAIESVRNNPNCLAFSGSVGDRVASGAVGILRKENINIAHVAPWLQNSSLEVDDNTFPIFAARQEQISFALKSLSLMGIKELGTVYGTTGDFTAFHEQVERIASGMRLKLVNFQGSTGLRALGQKLTPQTPAVLVFIGGTPELAEFTQGLAKQSRQRFIVAMADVNLQTLQQMGAGRNTPVVATQPVPTVTSGVAMVRSYRETMARLFDEPPTSLSLAGFIAARYTYEVLNSMNGPLTRASVLSAFQKRASLDMGGFQINFNSQHRSSNYVTQSMMTPDGRVIG